MDVWQASRLSASPDHDYLPDVTNLQSQGKIGEALAICHFVEKQSGMPHRDEISALGVKITQEQAGWLGKCKRFASGFVTGKMTSPEATFGTVVSDFLVTGDLRDLSQQGYNAATGQEVDKVIVTLAALGTTASAISWIPEPGEPAAAGTDAGLSLFKGLHKINALTSPFAKESLEIAREAAKTRKLGSFGELFGQVGSLARRVPSGTLGTAMKDVESLEDLKAVTRWTRVAPEETVVALDVADPRALGWLKATGEDSSKLLGRALRKGAVGIAESQKLLRGAKFLYRGRLGPDHDRNDRLVQRPSSRAHHAAVRGTRCATRMRDVRCFRVRAIQEAVPSLFGSRERQCGLTFQTTPLNLLERSSRW